MDEEIKEDLGFGDSYDRAMETKKFFVPHGDATVGIGRSLFFVSEPTVVHFGGFKTQTEHSQTISIINSSSHSQRMSILPPTTSEFKISFSKCGILAPGMSQKITILFTPNEYKYHYDCIRIHTEGQDLLIPIHGYPLMNKVNFPTQISFGNTPLCEAVEKTVSIQCSIPVNFFYSIDVIQPHPYFVIKPLKGIVPANGSVQIHITFNPITLGTCTSVIRLFIAEHNFTPIETVINARAVSGIIEKNALEQAEERISTLLMKKSQEVTQKFGETTFKSFKPPSSAAASDFTPNGTSTTAMTTSNFSEISPRTSKLKNNSRSSGQKSLDPVGVVLKKTFGENNIESTLKNAILKPNNGTLLLSSKVPTITENGPLHGTHQLIGNLASTQPVPPRGVGSGNVFDAGAEYITQMNQTISEANRNKAKKTKPEESEAIVDGLRIPTNLNSTAAVNFVLTQEPGKLKPKDLKVAIERNREERRKQELEQTKIRQEGGGQVGGGLDLRAILVDEKLNSEPGDAFKRQLREMAFLADVDETKRQEVEKSFRVSEEFIGANILSPEELKIVDNQRRTYHHHRSRADWRKYQSRMNTTYHIPHSDEFRAGAPPPSSHFQENSSINSVIQSNPPSFDSNKNDVWSKRMNTLRKFIYLVGKWILQRRVQKRLKMIQTRLKEAGVVDNASARKFIEIENSTPFNASATSNLNSKASNVISQDAIQSLTTSNPSTQSLASLICLLPNQALERSLHAEVIAKESLNPTIEMFRRVLFPKHIVDEVSLRKPLPSASIDEPLTFDDRTFFSLKNRMEFMDLKYERENVPLSPIYFKPISKIDLQRWEGGSEEKLLRPPAGSLLSQADFETLMTNGCDQIFNNSICTLPDLKPKQKSKPRKEKSISFEDSPNGDNETTASEITFKIESEFSLNSLEPSWLTDTEYKDPLALYSEPSTDRDLCRNHYNYRTYQPNLTSKETDLDWVLRPTLERFEYDVNPTLREKFLATPGFLSAQTYLLASNISRSEETPLPPPGPTITDFYLPDCDIHGSGLCCQPFDYQRTSKQDDPDILPLQSKLAQEDYLTDSESDDDEDYKLPKPTLNTVKSILRPPPPPAVVEQSSQEPPAKGGAAAAGKKGKEQKQAPAAPIVPVVVETPKTNDHDAFSVLDEADRKVDQVELLRDRKTLEHAIHQQKIREEKLATLTNRLLSISKASTCPSQSLAVQLPLGDYSDELYTILQNQIEPLSNIFTEAASTFGSPSKPFLH